MRKVGIFFALLLGWINCASAAISEQASTPLSVWQALLGLMVLALIGAVIFAIIKAISGRKREATEPPDTEDLDRVSFIVPSNGMSDSAAAEGGQKQPHEKFCHECGAVIRVRAEICPKCGVRQPAVYSRSDIATAQAGRSKLTAALFALLLGGLGMHKFYLGRTGQGIFYLLFCWTFIPAIIAIVEGIVLLSMSERNFQQKYSSV